MADYTHRIGLWLNNDEGFYRSCLEDGREAARVWRKRNEFTEDTRDELCDAISNSMARWAEMTVGEMIPTLPPMINEILDLAFREVDWHEIVGGYVDEIMGENEYDESDE